MAICNLLRFRTEQTGAAEFGAEKAGKVEARRRTWRERLEVGIYDESRTGFITVASALIREACQVRAGRAGDVQMGKRANWGNVQTGEVQEWMVFKGSRKVSIALGKRLLSAVECSH